MANTPITRQAAESALNTHVGITGGAENDFTTKIVDLIADLLLLLPDDETAERVAAAAIEHASHDRSESV
jgi:hypothetical protein